MIGTCYNDSHTILFDSEPSLLIKGKAEKIAEKISKETSDMILEQLNKKLKESKSNKSKPNR